MSFFGALGNVLKGAAMGAIGMGATGAAKGAEGERMTAADYALKRDQLGLNAAAQAEKDRTARAVLDLQQREFAQQAQADAYRKAMRAALTQNWKPADRGPRASNISFVSGMSPDMLAAAELLRGQAMGSLEKGTTFEALPTYSPYDLASSPTIKSPSTFEKVMGILGAGATGVDAYNRSKNKQTE